MSASYRAVPLAPHRRQRECSSETRADAADDGAPASGEPGVAMVSATQNSSLEPCVLRPLPSGGPNLFARSCIPVSFEGSVERPSDCWFWSFTFSTMRCGAHLGRGPWTVKKPDLPRMDVGAWTPSSLQILVTSCGRNVSSAFIGTFISRAAFRTVGWSPRPVGPSGGSSIRSTWARWDGRLWSCSTVHTRRLARTEA